VARIVVVGGGLAGLQTVAALRRQGSTDALVLVGAELHPPYDRPPLTKAVLHGESEDSTLDADWAGWDVDVHLGRTATGLRTGVLETDAGDLAWDRLVIATGSVPVRFPGTAAARTLRTREDALALRAMLRPGVRLVIVGAGWIGAEVATAAVKAGVHVTVVEALDAPLANALPADCGKRMLPWWAPVDLVLGESVRAVEPGTVHLSGGHLSGGHLSGGSSLPADVVLLGVGSRPATAWLHGTPVCLTERGAVEVDSGLRSAMPGVWAVGDAAAWSSQRYGRRMHVEHWDNALHAPAVAATTLLGGEAVWDPVPYFWSEQWGHMVQYAGHHVGADRVVWREDGDTWAAFWLTGDRLSAALAVDRPRDLVQSRRLMDSGGRVDEAALADPARPVKSAAIG
jgi:3-phenylpropionate/trans-cinnamate dioxygenase ferredoxin reductase component